MKDCIYLNIENDDDFNAVMLMGKGAFFRREIANFKTTQRKTSYLIRNL